MATGPGITRDVPSTLPTSADGVVKCQVEISRRGIDNLWMSWEPGMTVSKPH